VSDKLRIGYFADGPWGHDAFQKIVLESSLEIVFVVPRYDSKDRTLLNLAKSHSVDYFKLENVNSKKSLAKIDSYKCDILVSMSFNQIFREEILNIAPKGVINCHAGALPFYRGRNILNWALINGEKEFGITVHHVDEGIDTGDIINQELFVIQEEDTYRNLLEIAYVECGNILKKSLLQIQQGTAQRMEQSSIDPMGFYCGRRKMGDERINWNNTSREVHNFIRAISTPGPNARTLNQKGEEIIIEASKYLESVRSYIGIPGQVLSKTENGFIVKTSDTFIEVIEFQGKIRVGDRLQ
jgi:methionyl-tRNA formyltransferase